MSDVFAVRCPAPACRKYMLVEAADRGTVVPCLICRAGIQIPAGPATPATPAPSPPHAAPSPGYDFAPKK